MNAEVLSDSEAEDGGKGTVPYFSSFPSSVKYLVATEFCERFSFYGLKAILALYLYQHLHINEDTATELVHLFVAVSFTAPLLGGFFSDGLWGNYKTILYLEVLYAVGAWILLTASLPQAQTLSSQVSLAVVGSGVGIFLVALSAGGIRPCVPSFGADQIQYSVWNVQTREVLQRRFFSIFYFFINAGSVVTKLLTPFLRTKVSYGVAFSVPATMSVLALGCFLWGRRSYTYRAPEGNVYSSLVGIIWDALRTGKATPSSTVSQPLIMPQEEGSTAGHWLDSAKASHEEEEVEEVKQLLRIAVVLLPTPVFWALADQQSSKWVFQGTQMDREVWWLGGLIIEPDQMVALNPTMVLLMIPLVDQLVYPFLKKLHIPWKPLWRMAGGMLCTAFAFVVAGLLQVEVQRRAADGRPQLSILWQIPQFALISAGEVLFSITGLAFAYSEAPARMKAAVQSLWWLTVAGGNLVTIVMVAAIGQRLSMANEFFVFAGVCCGAMLLLSRLASSFSYRS